MIKPAINTVAQRRIRILALILGILIFVWLPFEDTTLRWLILLAIAICAWGAARLLIGFPSSTRIGVWIYPISGALAGIAVAPTAIVLMIIKSGSHGHGTADFTIDQVVTLILRTPVWVISGILIGLGILLWKKTKPIQD